MNNNFFYKYGFKEISKENYAIKNFLLVTSFATINNCSIRAITMYNKEKVTREKFSIDEVNGKDITDLSEEQRNICNNLEAKARLDRFDNPDGENIRTEEAFDDLMDDLDEITAFLSIAIK